jgi:hypothetical protein
MGVAVTIPMKLRIAIVIVYGLAAGVATYADAHEYIDDGLHIGLLAFGVLVGALVGRAWALLALIGPLASLGYLQAIGYVETNHDGVDPLLSAPGFSRIVWLGLAVLIGLGLHAVLRPLARRRTAAQEG